VNNNRLKLRRDLSEAKELEEDNPDQVWEEQ
jgi:hypothetical protein